MKIYVFYLFYLFFCCERHLVCAGLKNVELGKSVKKQTWLTWDKLWCHDSFGDDCQTLN